MKTIIHRNNTVTVFDISSQTWRKRVNAYDIWETDSLMSSLSSKERRAIGLAAIRAAKQIGDEITSEYVESYL